MYAGHLSILYRSSTRTTAAGHLDRYPNYTGSHPTRNDGILRENFRHCALALDSNFTCINVLVELYIV